MSRDAAAVLVVPTGVPSGPWACRSLARAGYRVIGADESGSGRRRGRSRHCPRPIRYPPPGRQPGAFLTALERICRLEGVGVVLPLSEGSLHLVISERPDLAGAVLAGPTSDQYRRLCDKAALAQVAAECGVDCPAGIAVGASDADGAWPALPLVVKPLTSATPRPAGVRYLPAVRVTSVSERNAAVRRAVEMTGGAWAQEWRHGRGWRLHFVRSAGRLDTLAQLTVRRYPPRTGMSSVSVTAAPPPELVAATARLLDAVDYRGPGSAQFIEHEGRFLVHDVNLRLPFTVVASIAAGLDMPRLAVATALEDDSRPGIVARRPVRHVSLAGETRALVDALRGRPREASAARIAFDLALAALLPGRVLDPWFTTDRRATADALTRFLHPR